MDLKRVVRKALAYLGYDIRTINKAARRHLECEEPRSYNWTGLAFLSVISITFDSCAMDR